MSLAVQQPESVGMSAQRLDRIRPAMQAYVDQRGFAGISAMVARRGQVVYSGQVGWRDREAQLPMAADTIFRIYSMTKPVVCTALMLLYEEGRLQLVDPVAKYIPAFAATKVLSADGGLADQSPARPMQVRDLMMHTSGLTYDFLEDSPAGQMYRDARLMNDASRSLEALVGELARIPLAFQPGTRWQYSVGIDVAAHLIEVVSGQPLGAFLQERLFGPLGMADTGFGVPAEKLGRLAAMYGHPDLCGPGMTLAGIFGAWMAGDNGRRDVSATYPTDAPATFVRGGHGLFSTAGDYMRFALMLANGGAADGQRIIGRKTLELMHTNHLPAALLPYDIGGIPYAGYGFGLGSRVMMDVGASGGAGSVGEYGWSGAAKTYYWVDPQEQLAGVFMTQYMVGFDLPEQDLRAIAYAAIED
jgi:CubicO group peptidase (beta-lactamase class C family)